MTTLADAFNPEDRVSVKYSDFYRIIENSCSQAAALMYIKNAIMAGVPNCYIRSMLDGQKHWEDIDDYQTKMSSFCEMESMNKIKKNLEELKLIDRIETCLNETEDNNGED